MGPQEKVKASLRPPDRTPNLGGGGGLLTGKGSITEVGGINQKTVQKKPFRTPPNRLKYQSTETAQKKAITKTGPKPKQGGKKLTDKEAVRRGKGPEGKVDPRNPKGNIRFRANEKT